MRTITFEYDSGYFPSAPFVEIAVSGFDSEDAVRLVRAFVDSGADGTMIPLPILEAVGAEYSDTVWMRGVAGGRQTVDRYTVKIKISDDPQAVVDVVALPSNETVPILGRDILNNLNLTLNGLANQVEVHFIE